LDPEEVELEHNYVATNTLVKCTYKLIFGFNLNYCILAIVQTNEITREENSEEMSGITVVRVRFWCRDSRQENERIFFLLSGSYEQVAGREKTQNHGTS
jgi:hypothetical protein